MSDERQPETVWYFPPQKNTRWKVWLLVGLGVIAVALVLVFLLVVLPGSFKPEPTASPSASPSATATETSTPTPTATSAPTEAPTAEPTPPPVSDPSLDEFAEQVRPVLDDAVTGLGYAAEDGGESGANDVQLLQQDAERLADAVAPSSISGDWADAVSGYLDALNALQSAYRGGSDVNTAEDAARSALRDLRDLVGI